MGSLEVPNVPCASCPYRQDHPSGTWGAHEYEKLRGYDGFAMGTFLCHQTNATGREAVCVGWMLVHADSVAVRLAVARGEIGPADPYRRCGIPLHESGGAAADAGLEDIEDPGPEARAMVEKLIRRGAGKWDDDE